MAGRSERLDSDIDFANLEDVQDSGPSEIGSRRLTDLGGRVLEATRTGWLAWLVTAVVIASGIVSATWMLVSKIWPLEDELLRVQAELVAAKQESERLTGELNASKLAKEQADKAHAALAGELERQKVAAVDNSSPDDKKAASKKLPRKKRGKRR